MSILTFNQTKCCPECGCTKVISEEIKIEYSRDRAGHRQLRSHINGGMWEVRTFLCGFCTEYIPNYNRDVAKSPCTHSQEWLERKAKLDNLDDKIRKMQDEKHRLWIKNAPIES